jgi:hypothetical protein
LANTGLRRPRHSHSARPWPALVGVALCCLILLSACAGGNAESSNEAATHEAEEATNVVAAIEATQVVREFFEERSPTPYPTVLPTLANLRMTHALRDQDAPGDTLYRYTRGSGPLYADAQIANLFPGQRVIAVWSFQGETMQTTEVGIDNRRELVWIAMRWDIPTSAPAGNYVVTFFVAGPGTNDEGTPAEVQFELGSVVLQVT